MAVKQQIQVQAAILQKWTGKDHPLEAAAGSSGRASSNRRHRQADLRPARDHGPGRHGARQPRRRCSTTRRRPGIAQIASGQGSSPSEGRDERASGRRRQALRRPFAPITTRWPILTASALTSNRTSHYIRRSGATSLPAFFRLYNIDVPSSRGGTCWANVALTVDMVRARGLGRAHRADDRGREDPDTDSPRAVEEARGSSRPRHGASATRATTRSSNSRRTTSSLSYA